MKELTEYRTKLLERLTNAAAEFRDACLAVADPFAPIDGGWNVHQIAAHTRDVQRLVYGLRARRTVEEENPEFPNFDGDAYMAEHYDAGEPLREMLDNFVAEVEALTEMLRKLPAEAWSRESRHATLGSGFTLQRWVERALAHIEEHLKAVRQSG
ncbi:MAG: DinB family protein [Chloroflexota bacterium]|nr:DinB family protein [Chloroflexota bacterium]MBI5704398.1 DinB family protein [Chloroflexota bacterium]